MAYGFVNLVGLEAETTTFMGRPAHPESTKQMLMVNTTRLNNRILYHIPTPGTRSSPGLGARIIDNAVQAMRSMDGIAEREVASRNSC